jgi:hypothetical protein
VNGKEAAVPLRSVIKSRRLMGIPPGRDYMLPHRRMSRLVHHSKIGRSRLLWVDAVEKGFVIFGEQ